MTIQVSPTESQQWIRTVDRRTGRQLAVLVPSASTPNKFHVVTRLNCDCRGFQYRGDCRHVRAVQAEVEVRTATATAAPASFAHDASIGGTIQAPEAARRRCLADDIWGVDGE